MALFDLGGVTVDDSPNANVMYELGIRHAFGKPAVLYSWRLQPFDVAEQHAVLMPREQSRVGEVQQQIIAAMRQAAAGRFYNPMADVELARLVQSVAASDDRLRPIVDILAKLEARLVACTA